MLIGNKVKTEATFLNQICSKSKINLCLEEIVPGNIILFSLLMIPLGLLFFINLPGIMHSSAERVLIQAMKSFVEDVVRRSFAGKMITGDDNK